ncbi:hypothetical protein MRX96_030654 [Rhipicephalus microplus]
MNISSGSSEESAPVWPRTTPKTNAELPRGHVIAIDAATTTLVRPGTDVPAFLSDHRAHLDGPVPAWEQNASVRDGRRILIPPRTSGEKKKKKIRGAGRLLHLADVEAAQPRAEAGDVYENAALERAQLFSGGSLAGGREVRAESIVHEKAACVHGSALARRRRRRKQFGCASTD